MSIYTTPLQFGYFFSLIFFLLFLIRGIREERLSDRLFAIVMLILALELQDYTFGFSGINFLWNEMNGFPRDVALLFGPAIYFYMRSQVNRAFTLQWKHTIHLLPWGLHFCVEFIIYISGPEAVQNYQSSSIHNFIGYEFLFLLWASYFYYFRVSLLLYKKYRAWAINQFSDIPLVSFQWFKWFVYGMIAIVISKELLKVLDFFYDWDFYQDWWWNLVIVVVAVYVGVAGYKQYQPPAIAFHPVSVKQEKVDLEENDQKKQLKEKLERVMKDEQLFLEAEITLSGLAKQLKTSSSLLSATINQLYHLNFNDYINQQRINTFIAEYKNPENKKFTMLSIAYDCGFNSKATFNRAFKKLKGKSPKEYFSG